MSFPNVGPPAQDSLATILVVRGKGCGRTTTGDTRGRRSRSTRRATAATAVPSSRRLTGMRIHHVNVVVPPGRTDEVVPFYTEVLGLPRVAKPTSGVDQSGAWFDVDEASQLHVSERG